MPLHTYPLGDYIRKQEREKGKQGEKTTQKQVMEKLATFYIPN